MRTLSFLVLALSLIFSCTMGIFAQDAAAGGAQGPQKKDISLMGVYSTYPEAEPILAPINQKIMTAFQSLQRFNINAIQDKSVSISLEEFITQVQGMRADAAFNSGNTVLEADQVDKVLTAFYVIAPVISNFNLNVTEKVIPKETPPQQNQQENTDQQQGGASGSATVGMVYPDASSMNAELAYNENNPSSMDNQLMQVNIDIGGRASVGGEADASNEPPDSATAASNQPGSTSGTQNQQQQQVEKEYHYSASMTIDIQIFNMADNRYETPIIVSASGSAVLKDKNDTLGFQNAINNMMQTSLNVTHAVKSSDVFKIRTHILESRGKEVILEGGADFDLTVGRTEWIVIDGKYKETVGYLRTKEVRPDNVLARVLWGEFSMDAEIVENAMLGTHVKFKIGAFTFNQPNDIGALLDAVIAVDAALDTGTKLSSGYAGEGGFTIAYGAQLYGEYEIGYGGRFFIGGGVGVGPGGSNLAVGFTVELGFGYNIYLGRFQIQPRLAGGLYGYADKFTVNGADFAQFVGVTGGLMPGVDLVIQVSPNFFIDFDLGGRIGFPSESLSYTIGDASGNISDPAAKFSFIGGSLMIGFGGKF